MRRTAGSDTQGALGLDPLLLEILACPCEAHGALVADEAANQIVCTVCQARFDIENGIPVMLMSEA